MDARRYAIAIGLREGMLKVVERQWDDVPESLREQVGTQAEMAKIGFEAEVELLRPILVTRFTEPEFEALVSAIEDLEGRFPGVLEKQRQVTNRLANKVQGIVDK